MGQEDLEDIDHKFPRGEILGLDAPGLTPGIDVQELLLESGGRGDDRFRQLCFCFPAHAVELYGLAIAETALVVACKGINPDALDGLGIAMEGVELATALRVTEVLPVGGFVAGSGEAGFLNEGFQQDWTIRVAGMPVLDQASADQGEHARSEIFAVYPRHDQEARVVEDR